MTPHFPVLSKRHVSLYMTQSPFLHTLQSTYTLKMTMHFEKNIANEIS